MPAVALPGGVPRPYDRSVPARPTPRRPQPGTLALACGLVASLSGCAHTAETRRTELRVLSQKTVDVRLDRALHGDASSYDARVRLDLAAPGGPAVVVGVFVSDTCERRQHTEVEETVVVLREGAPETREPPTIRTALRPLGLHACNTRPAGGISVETRWSRWIRGTKRFDECDSFSGSTGADGLLRIPLDALRNDACRTGSGQPWRLGLRIMDVETRWPEEVDKALMAALAEGPRPVVPPSSGPVVPPFPGPRAVGGKR